MEVVTPYIVKINKNTVLHALKGVYNFRSKIAVYRKLQLERRIPREGSLSSGPFSTCSVLQRPFLSVIIALYKLLRDSQFAAGSLRDKRVQIGKHDLLRVQ